jgi:DNA-binding IclR family transcriptional regulator
VINLPCVSADGKPTQSGIATLTAIKNGASTAQKVSEKTGQPMFKVRSGLRELVNAGLVKQIETGYSLTEQGTNILK